MHFVAGDTDSLWAFLPIFPRESTNKSFNKDDAKAFRQKKVKKKPMTNDLVISEIYKRVKDRQYNLLLINITSVSLN